jgi:sulfhydrogenase subunit beta (sulfur reductase)
VRAEGTRMEAKLLQRDKLCQLVDALVKDHKVIAPRDELAYGEINSSTEFYLGDGKPRQSLKEFFFPRREVLFEYRYSRDGVELTAPASLDNPRVIVGARPCDAGSFPILDKLFAWDYVDRFYLELRESTTIVSLACEEPCRTCFCVSVGGSPADIEGSDLLLTPLREVYHVLIITDRGQALVEQYCQFFQDSDEIRNRERAQVEDQYREQIVKRVDPEALREALDFDRPGWQTLTPQCVDCGVCTFLCPTCHCFDIQDEGRPDEGSRVRLWDSCASQDFTKMPVAQPRPTHYRRYRQRLMHKFKYYPENFGRVLCVGCGRCIQYCPVGVDITEALKTAAE